MTDAFWSKVKRLGPDDCWPWTGGKNSYGHGIFHDGINKKPAHRTAYELSSGQVRADLMVIHSCDDLSCCNPSHLFTGTAEDLGSMNRKHKRFPDRHGASNPNAKLTSEQITEIRCRIGKGQKNTAIAKDYGISHSMVSLIRRGKAWKETEAELSDQVSIRTQSESYPL